MDSVASLPALNSVIKALGVMSSTSLIAILMSTLTSKIISVVLGAEGVAIVGLYRSLAAIVTSTVIFGYSTVIVQQMGKARDSKRINEIVTATAVLFILQTLVCLVLVFFGAPPLAHWIMGAAPSSTDVLNVRIVIVMALVNILLALVTSILQGESKLGPLSAIQVITSTASLLLIYPLLHLGNTGLAINVGSGTAIGACVGIFFTIRQIKPILTSWSEGWRTLKQTSSHSSLITIQMLLTMGGLLLVQTIVNHRYGLEPLGNYNAAMLVLDTGILVLMASIRSYFLPALGRLNDPEEKQELFSTLLSLLLLLATAGGMLLIVASKWIVPILFSGKFGLAIELIPALSLSVTGTIFIWGFNTVLLHHEDYRWFVFIDAIWMALFIGLVLYFSAIHLPLVCVAYAYAIASTFSGLLYLGVTLKRHGTGYLCKRNALLAPFMMLLLSIFYRVFA